MPFAAPFKRKIAETLSLKMDQLSGGRPLFILIVQTGVGMLQGAIERIDSWRKESTGAGLGKLGHAGFASAAVLASAALSSIGLVNLIAQGYNYLSIIFAVIFVLPLLLVGIPRIVRQSRAERSRG